MLYTIFFQSKANTQNSITDILPFQQKFKLFYMAIQYSTHIHMGSPLPFKKNYTHTHTTVINALVSISWYAYTKTADTNIYKLNISNEATES